jgi:hypothetical protein
MRAHWDFGGFVLRLDTGSLSGKQGKEKADRRENRPISRLSAHQFRPRFLDLTLMRI